jgi:cystathionine beta-lyase
LLPEFAIILKKTRVFGFWEADLNFDIPIDRSGTDTVKWEEMDQGEGKAGVIPLWVADMDFPCPPAISRALQERAAHPVYGYTRSPEDFFQTLVLWYKTQYHVDLGAGDFLAGPGSVPSLGVAVRTLSSPGDGVLILTPVYYPFFNMIRLNGRETVEAPLVRDGAGRYHFEKGTLEAALAAARERKLKVPLALFCSPHNPGGAVWRRDELEGFLAFARREGITVVSDEVHGDFVFPPRDFISLAAFPDYADMTVVVSGANKSFNLGGLAISHFAVRDEKLKSSLQKGCAAMAFHHPNLFSRIAVQAAYREGGPWLEELKIYIEGNIEAAVSAINAGIPGLRACKPEGTYLLWTDVSALIRRESSGAGPAGRSFRDDTELAFLLEREARVKVTPGSAFGGQGAGFIRINAACPRAQLLKGINRIRDFLSSP